MPAEPKEVRIQLLLSRAETDAVDEWRYANRVPSRNEALRRLVHYGLSLSQHQARLADLAELLAKIQRDNGLAQNEDIIRAIADALVLAEETEENIPGPLRR